MSKISVIGLNLVIIRGDNMTKLLEKAATYTFGNPDGDCFLMAMCLSKYMLEEEGIMLKSHIGGIKNENNENDIVTHLWSSYNGKIIDLTSHRQPELVVNGVILDEPIKVLENATRVKSQKMKNLIFREFAQSMVERLRVIDKNAISVSHLFLDYRKTGVVPYKILQNALDYKITRTPSLYQNFYNYMKS